MWALLGGLHVVAARTGMLLGARYVKVNRSMSTCQSSKFKLSCRAVSLSLVKPMEPVLDSIGSRLNDLGEQYMLDVINQDDYAFSVHDLLQLVPTAPAPSHLPILRRVKDWKEMTLITTEQAQQVQQWVIAASKE